MFEKKNRILDEIAKFNPEWLGIADTKLIYLYEIAKQCTYPIVEIGCGDGFYTIALAFGSRDGNNVKVISIDPHAGLATVPIENPADEINFTDSKYIGTLSPVYSDEILRNGTSYEGLMKHIEEWGVTDIVKPIVNYSELAFKKIKDLQIELLLIDGDHRYHFVKNDFELYSQLVVPNGYIAFDDVGLVGVDTVIAELEGRNDLRKESGGGFIIVRPIKMINFEGYQIAVRNEIHDLNAMISATDTFKAAHVKPLNIVIDIGAHCGGLSLIAAKSGAMRVFAFEATALNYFYLVNNVLSNHLEDVITPYHLAVAKNTGDTIDLYMAEKEGNSNASAYGNVGNSKFSAYTIAFYHILEHFDCIDYLKIDVEGMEFEFIEQSDAMQQLLSKVRFLDLEIYPDVFLHKVGQLNDPDVLILKEQITNYLERCGFDFDNDFNQTYGFLKGWRKD